MARDTGTLPLQTLTFALDYKRLRHGGSAKNATPLDVFVSSTGIISLLLRLCYESDTPAKIAY